MKVHRRQVMAYLTPEELYLLSLVESVEKLGAHPLLTDTVVLLGQAREKLADWFEQEQGKEKYVEI